jgi:predicted protein tyrosine phosphatase
VRRIVVGSILDAQQFRPAPGERYAVLSIVDTAYEPPRIPQREGFVDRLVVHADDCTPRDRQLAFDGRTLCPLSGDQAAEIAGFVRGVAPRVDTLVVHCHMGASRSPGAALAIAEAFAVADVEMITGPGVMPNPHVRSLVRAALRRP